MNLIDLIYRFTVSMFASLAAQLIWSMRSIRKLFIFSKNDQKEEKRDNRDEVMKRMDRLLGIIKTSVRDGQATDIVRLTLAKKQLLKLLREGKVSSKYLSYLEEDLEKVLSWAKSGDVVVSLAVSDLEKEIRKIEKHKS